MDHNLSDLVMEKISQLLNSMLDMDERTKTGLSSAFGIFLTLYSLHKIEVKLKELVQLILTFKLIYIVLIVLVISLLVYGLIKYKYYLRVFDYFYENFELKHLFVGSIVFLVFVTIGSQFIKPNETQSPKLNSTDSSPIDRIYLNDNNLNDFNQNFLKILSNLSRKHLTNDKLNLTEKSKNKSKVQPLSELNKNLSNPQLEIFNDSIKLYMFLSNFYMTHQDKLQLSFLKNHLNTQSKSSSIFDMWKFMVKIIIFSIINLLFIYLIIRSLMWVIVETSSEKSIDEDNISGLDLNFSPTSSIDRTEPTHESETDNSSEISKKRSFYIKNNTLRKSPSRLEKKSLLKKALKSSISLDGNLDSDQYDHLPILNTPKKLIASLVDLFKIENTEPVEEILVQNEVAVENEIPNDMPDENIQDDFNLEFFINWLTSDNICNDFNLDKEIDCNLAYIVNESVANMINNESIDTKYDDINFTTVDTLPPKFTNIQTVVSDNHNLTLKSNVEFKNIELKAEFKKSHRHIDVTVQTASGQALIVLGQSKNSASYILDCSFDPQSELLIEFKNDQSIEKGLINFLENVLKNTIKQFSLNLELNFQNKKLTGSTKMNTQHHTPHPNISFTNQNSPITISNKGQSSSPQPPNSKTSPEPTKTNQDSQNSNQLRNSINEKRLLVKLLKANNLANCEEPYCVVELDYPMQKHLTDVHKDISSINEQFLFDITPNSEELSIYVYDRAKDYGNDLIGEAVLPVNDLCSGTGGKRVIQLHRFGSQKTGSVTVEFIFIEPVNPRIEIRGTRGSLASRTSRSPFDPSEKPTSVLNEMKNVFNYRDELQNDQKLKSNLDNLSLNSLTGTRPSHNFAHSPISLNQNTNIQILNDSTTRHHYIQPSQTNESLLTTVNPGTNLTTNPKIINRNHLQIQPSNLKSNTLNSNQLLSSIYSDGSFKTNDSEEHKRTRSISRSVRSLFKPKSSKKRDKSYDVQTANNYDLHSVDGDNLKKTKTIGGSLKKLFNIKKTSKKYEGSVHEKRPGSPISITVSRPIDSNFSSSQHTGHLLTSVNTDYMSSSQPSYQTIHSNNYGEMSKNDDESFERKEPLILKRN